MAPAVSRSSSSRQCGKSSANEISWNVIASSSFAREAEEHAQLRVDEEEPALEIEMRDADRRPIDRHGVARGD